MYIYIYIYIYIHTYVYVQVGVTPKGHSNCSGNCNHCGVILGMSTLPLWSVVSPARLDKAQNYRCATGRPMRLPTAPAYPRLYQGGWFKTPGTNTTPT